MLFFFAQKVLFTEETLDAAERRRGTTHRDQSLNSTGGKKIEGLGGRGGGATLDPSAIHVVKSRVLTKCKPHQLVRVWLQRRDGGREGGRHGEKSRESHGWTRR